MLKKYWLTVSLFFITSISFACADGTISYNGACYRDFKPIESDNIGEVQPSDEKPPRSGLPSWQDPHIHADMGIRAVEPSTTVAHDYVGERDQK